MENRKVILKAQSQSCKGTRVPVFFADRLAGEHFVGDELVDFGMQYDPAENDTLGNKKTDEELMLEMKDRKSNAALSSTLLTKNMISNYAMRRNSKRKLEDQDIFSSAKPDEIMPGLPEKIEQFAAMLFSYWA